MGASRGIDVSVYQGVQDWAAHKKSGVVFGFAKASEGEHTRDAHFNTHITGIKKAGLVPGAYHFAWPNQPAAAEAANYIAAVKPYAGKGFVHWLDLERRTDGKNYAGLTAAEIEAYAAAWIADVQHAFPGQRVGVYTSGSDLAAGHVPSGVTLWYPAYPGASADTYAEAEKHAQPKPSGHTPLFWQFTSRDPNGASLDRSICYLSAADLRTWAGGTATTTKPKVSLAHVIAAAKKDPGAAQGHTTYKADVLLVEKALDAENLLDPKYVDGSFGTLTKAAYAKWQRICAGGKGTHTGTPGKDSLSKLAAKHGFTVVA